MYHSKIVPVVVAACLVAGTSCSESTTAPKTNSSRSSPIPPTPFLVTVSGTIHTLSRDMDAAYLTTADGDDVFLLGSETVNLAGLDGAEVDVRGSWVVGGLALTDFLVRRVGGADVLDGKLTMLVDENTGEVGYGLALTRGSLVPLTSPTDALLAHLGQRLWVTEPADGQPLIFGVIGPQTE
jgi:hypothetical protein